MISRNTIYDHFVNNVNTSIDVLESKIYYYNSKLSKSNDSLELYHATLAGSTEEFNIIYDIDVDSISTNTVKVNYINKTVIDGNRGIKTIANLLHKLNPSNGVHTVLFIKGVTDKYINVLNEIANIKRQLRLLDDKLTFFNKYKGLSRNVVFYILSKCNKYYEDLILDGETVYLGHHLGFIKVVPKKAKGKVDWNESLKYKAKLIEEGKTPYNKDDHLKAKAANLPYDGVKWFIPYDNEIQHYINWYPYSNKLPNKRDYSFTPARYNKSDKTISAIKDEVKDIKELDTYHIGIVNKLNIALTINDNQFIKYAGYDI